MPGEVSTFHGSESMHGMAKHLQVHKTDGAQSMKRPADLPAFATYLKDELGSWQVWHDSESFWQSTQRSCYSVLYLVAGCSLLVRGNRSNERGLLWASSFVS